MFVIIIQAKNKFDDVAKNDYCYYCIPRTATSSNSIQSLLFYFIVWSTLYLYKFKVYYTIHSIHVRMAFFRFWLSFSICFSFSFSRCIRRSSFFFTRHLHTNDFYFSIWYFQLELGNSHHNFYLCLCISEFAFELTVTKR